MKEKIVSKRNYGIDLLRITAMFFVLILHILGQGGVISNTVEFSAQYKIAWFLETAAFCAVNCYALISGYVGVESRFKYSNIIVLWLRVVFYTVIITFIFSRLKPEIVDSLTWERAFMPVINNQYWYFTAYFGMFFFIPLINTAINGMSQNKLKITVILFVIIFTVLQTFYRDAFGTASGYSVLWLIVVYIIGAYIKKYNCLKKCNAWMAFLGYLIMVAVTWGVEYIENSGMFIIFEDSNGLLNYTSPTILGASIFLLALFEKMRFPAFVNKIISFMSPLAFSVYLIHTHPFVWTYFMEGRFSQYATLPSVSLVAHVLMAAVIIYTVCSCVDWIREMLFKLLQVKWLMKKIDYRCSERNNKNNDAKM